MEETVTTTVETVSEQTTPDVVENQTTETTETDVQPDATQESETDAGETTETAEAETQTVEPTKNWEQIAKDNQASFTRVSQELAELKKQVAAQKPQLVQEGKINPEFEQQYKFDVDNKEFLAFDGLARQLEPETRAVVENLLNEARRLYNPNNNRAYEGKMAQIKDYFRSDIVEQIALEKQNLIGKMKGEFERALQADKQERANRIAERIEQVPELNELVQESSENYSPEVLGIIKQMFDYAGDIDIESTTKAISKIKELGVKEYLAKQNAEKAKAQANVPTGDKVVQQQSPTITAEMASKNYQKYIDDFMKNGLSFHDAMEKVDSIIMKGN